MRHLCAVPSVEGEEFRRGLSSSVCVHGDSRKILQGAAQPSVQAILVPGERGHRADQAIATSHRRLPTRHQIRQHVNGSDEPRQQLVRQGAEFESFGNLLGTRRQLVRVQRLPQGAGRGNDPQMRSEELVRRARIEISADLFDVDRCVGRQVHTIDEEQSVHRVGGLGDRWEIGTGSQDVGCSGDGHQARVVGYLIHDVTGRQFARSRVESRPRHLGASFLGIRHPRADVGVVIEIGHHDAIARTPILRQSPGHHERRFSHAPSKNNARGIASEKIGSREARPEHD